MVRKIINIGTIANDGTGDPLRMAFSKSNDNFSELYTTANTLTTQVQSLTIAVGSIPTDVSQLSDTEGLLFDGEYDSLTGKPTIPTDLSDLTDNQGLLIETSAIAPYLQLTNKAIEMPEVPLGNAITFTKENYADPTVFVDEVDEGLAITRGNLGWLYNPLFDLTGYAVDSPHGTLWTDEIDSLRNLDAKTYYTFYDLYSGQLNNIAGTKSIMKDTLNNKYYLFEFHEWTAGQNGGGVSYTRQEILADPSLFVKEAYGNQIDVISEGLQITRGDDGWLFNPLFEQTYGANTPTNSLWNKDGWKDLMNLDGRTYVPFEQLWNGSFGPIVGAELVLFDSSTGIYWAIKFTSWDDTGAGGSFSYDRYFINPFKTKEGITFADGSVQKTAYSEVVSTAPRGRRIVQESGFATVSLTERTVTATFSGSVLAPNPSQPWDVFIDGTIYTDLFAYVEQNQYQLLTLIVNNTTYEVQPYITNSTTVVLYNETGDPILHSEGDSYTLYKYVGGEPVKWTSFVGEDFRGAIVDYHAYFTGSGTMIGTIYMANDSGRRRANHAGTYSGDNTRLGATEIWYQDNNGNERDLYVRRLTAGGAETVKIHWTAKVFYGEELYD